MVAQDDLPLVFVDFDFLLVRQRLREVEDLRVRQLRVAISRPVRIEVDNAHLIEVFPFVTDHDFIITLNKRINICCDNIFDISVFLQTNYYWSLFIHEIPHED